MKTRRIVKWQDEDVTDALLVKGSSRYDATYIERVTEFQDPQIKDRCERIAYLKPQAVRGLCRAFKTREVELVEAGFLEKEGHLMHNKCYADWRDVRRRRAIIIPGRGRMYRTPSAHPAAIDEIAQLRREVQELRDWKQRMTSPGHDVEEFYRDDEEGE